MHGTHFEELQVFGGIELARSSPDNGSYKTHPDLVHVARKKKKRSQ